MIAGATVVGIILLTLENAYGTKRAITLVGTRDPARDTRAIQAAVDRGGTVIIQGHFSFGMPPKQPVDPLLASAWYSAAAEIRITKPVDISGVRDARGELPTIESGTIPFYVDAPGRRVTIHGLRFVRPIQAAVLVAAARELEISSSKIDGIVPSLPGSGGIVITTRGNMSMLSPLGKPENVSGHVLISDNDIDGSGGTARTPTGGIMVFSVGQGPDREAEVDIVQNTIRNTSAPAINIRRIQGPLRVLGNTVVTSSETVGDVDAVRLVNGSSILMANNRVECKWPNAAGIQVYSPYAEWPTERVVVEDNTVIMSPPANEPLGDFSAGISIRGFARDNVIRHDSVTGRANAALAVYVFRGGAPARNAFLDNRVDGFQAAMADVVVGAGVTGTRIVGRGSVLDRGTATIRGAATPNPSK